MKRNAIFYDFLEVHGGAEAVAIEVCRNNSSFDLFVGAINKSVYAENPEIPGTIYSLDKYTNLAGLKTIKCLRAFKKIKTQDYHTVIYTGSSAVSAVHNVTAEKHIYYCHTPPRFAYDLYDYYLRELPLPQRAGISLLAPTVRKEFESAISKVDQILCNSLNVQKRLDKFFGVDAEVLWPPVQINRMYHRPDRGFYLSTARVETYKRVELIAEAFSLMKNKRLVITSGGSLLSYLRSKYANYPNITFTNWVSDDHMRQLVAECIATIYLPIDEDFGMSPIESMAAGKPVIGVQEGGLLETMSHGDCGYMCRSNPSVADLIAAVEWLTPGRAASMKLACEARAKKFSPHVFHNRLAELTSV